MPMNAHNHDFAGASARAKAKGQAARQGFALRGHVVTGSMLALLLVLGCGGWAANAALNGAVVTQGAVKIDQNLKEVQHRDGGIVQSIAIRQGDRVEEGQVLFRLDDVQTRAELSIIRSQLAENLGRKARLVAERDNLPSIAFPSDIASLSDEDDHIREGETRLFTGNKANRDSRKEQLEISIVQSGEEIRGLEARQVAKIEELRLVDLERGKYLSLFQKGFIDGVKVFNINREWARLLGERGEIDATLARAKLRISDARLQIIAIDETARTEAQRELRQVDAKVSELSDRRIANEDRLARMEIRAPIAGTVNELMIFTVGGVITPAARLATIVPQSAKLVVEVRIAPSDIDQVHVGRRRGCAFRLSTATPRPKSPANWLKSRRQRRRTR